MKRSLYRLATPVALVYGAMLLVGLVMYTITRRDEPNTFAPLWVGSLLGTALGYFLALRDFRSWVALLVIIGIPCWCAPFAPPPLADENVWLAFIPAALCAFWSLGDRAALAAFWYPTVIWMLTVLDRTHGNSIPDGTGAAMLGILALMLFVFLRVRETRRVGLWQSVGATPLARHELPTVQKEPPGHQLARAGWTLFVSAVTFSVTAWVAPKLWHTETFAGDPTPVADLPEDGLPCCPVAWEPQTRTRVKEYFDIGRGHDEPDRPPRPGYDCQVCPTQGGDAIVAEFPNVRPVLPGTPCTYDDQQAGLCTLGGTTGASTGTGFVPAGRGGATGTVPPAPTTGEPVPGPVDQTATVVPDQATPPAPTPEPSPEPPTTTDPTPMPPDQMPQPQPQELPPEPPPQAHPEPQVLPEPQTPPATDRALPQVARPGIVDPPPPAATHAHRPPPAASTPAILPWIVALVAGACVFQLLTLALRPVRRAIALRHLRRPFWEETVDQRVSNFWQLALIGLRDAGWRTSSHEPPGELAKRVDIAGVASCATILDRARHGIAIDADDLGTMGAAAESVYRDARGTLGPGARALAWLRWPLA